MYVIIWAFQTGPTRRRKFEALYGPKGQLAKLFRQSADYLGTEFRRDHSRVGEGNNNPVTFTPIDTSRFELTSAEDEWQSIRVLRNRIEKT